MPSEDIRKEPLTCEQSEALHRDFNALRRKTALRAPRTIDELIAFLTFANAFGKSLKRYRPSDAGLWRI
jgi:hypothetical protein